jgi:hypothetical protein
MTMDDARMATYESAGELAPRAEHAKCHGVLCRDRAQCLRYLRPSAGFAQSWAHFDTWYRSDCQAFEPALRQPEGRGPIFPSLPEGSTPGGAPGLEVAGT